MVVHFCALTKTKKNSQKHVETCSAPKRRFSSVSAGVNALWLVSSAHGHLGFFFFSFHIHLLVKCSYCFKESRMTQIHHQREKEKTNPALNADLLGCYSCEAEAADGRRSSAVPLQVCRCLPAQHYSCTRWPPELIPELLRWDNCGVLISDLWWTRKCSDIILNLDGVLKGTVLI